MFNSPAPKDTKNKPLYLEIIDFYDEFTEFNEQCAFLCDAYASLALVTEVMDKTTAGGMQLSTIWLKKRVSEIKKRLKVIQKRSAKEFK